MQAVVGMRVARQPASFANLDAMIATESFMHLACHVYCELVLEGRGVGPLRVSHNASSVFILRKMLHPRDVKGT
eukprot:5325528-Amphidinium_carterae.1